MLKREYYGERFDGVKLYRNYSDIGNYILQHPTEIEYEEAVDVEDAPYTYTETDKPIPQPEPESDPEDEEETE